MCYSSFQFCKNGKSHSQAGVSFVFFFENHSQAVFRKIQEKHEKSQIFSMSWKFNAHMKKTVKLFFCAI